MSTNIPPLSRHAASLLARASENDLMRFKIDFLRMPKDLAKHPFFAASNIEQWAFIGNHYYDYIRRLIANSGRKNSDDSSSELLSSEEEDSDATPPPIYPGLLQFKPKDMSVSAGASKSKHKIGAGEVETDVGIQQGEGSRSKKRPRCEPLVHLGHIDLTAPVSFGPNLDMLVDSLIKKKKGGPIETVDNDGKVVIDLTSP